MRLCDPISVKTRHIVFMMKLWTFYRKMSSRHERQGISFLLWYIHKTVILWKALKKQFSQINTSAVYFSGPSVFQTPVLQGSQSKFSFSSRTSSAIRKNLYLTWPTCMILRGSCIARWCWPRMLRPVKDIWARLSPARTKSIIEVTGSDCRYSGYNGKNTSHLVVYPQYHDYL